MHLDYETEFLEMKRCVFRIPESRFLYLIFLLCLQVVVNAQDIEGLLSKSKKDSTGYFRQMFSGEPFSISGNYGLNIRSYSTNAATNRQTPLSSMLFANATARIYNIDIPFSFILNNLNDFNTPFHKGYLKGVFTNQRDRLTRLGFSPYYKWIKVHIGHRYMNFSDFTLSNHNFLGAGVELTPGKFRFAAMAGRLAKAEPIDLALDRPNLPVYRRLGYGMKVGYGTQNEYIDLIIFKAKDDPNSLDITGTPEVSVQPAENLVIGLKGRKEVVKNLNVDFEVARSGHTRDVADDRKDGARTFSLDFNNPLFRRRISSNYANAASANISYRLKKVQIGAGYQRIDPEYKTFGAYFFNDDLENYTLQLAAYGIKNFSFNGSAGLQRNNLDHSRPASYKRFIMALNANYQLKSWNFGANYSNFLSNINYLLSENLDSLKVIIVTSDASLNIGRNFTGRQGGANSINLRGGVQQVSQNIETPTGNPATNMYYANLGYNLRLKSGWNFSANADYNQNSLSAVRQDRYGGGLRVGKNLFKNKLDLTLGTQSYYGTSPSDIRSSLQSNHTFRLQWKVSRMQNLQLQLNSIQGRKTVSGVDTHFSEFIAMLGFNGRFEYRPFKKNVEPSSNSKINE